MYIMCILENGGKFLITSPHHLTKSPFSHKLILEGLAFRGYSFGSFISF